MGLTGGPRDRRQHARVALVAAAALLAACSGSSHRLISATSTTPSSASTTSTTLARAPKPPKPLKPLKPKSGAYVFALDAGGRTRAYRLHVPPAAAGGRLLPLVLNLHGATQNALLQELQSGMDASSDRHGYLVAYPDGTRIATKLTPDPVAKDAQYGFNAGNCCGLPVDRHVDDVGFLVSLITNVATRSPVDLRRVYVTGMSNGGMMAYTMAAEAAQHVAAVASVSGQVELTSVHPSRPVPTMEFHSINDPIAFWNGTADGDAHSTFSVMSGIERFVKADGCTSGPRVDRRRRGTAGSTSAGETATLVTYNGCASGTQVALWRFTGSGHVWPGALFNTGPRSTWILDGVGRGITLVDANEQMWQFFRRYSLPGG